MKPMKIIVEKHADGYVADPLECKCCRKNEPLAILK